MADKVSISIIGDNDLLLSRLTLSQIVQLPQEQRERAWKTLTQRLGDIIEHPEKLLLDDE